MVIDIEIFDKYSNIMEKLWLEDWLLEGRRIYEELFEKVGLKFEYDYDFCGVEWMC